MPLVWPENTWAIWLVIILGINILVWGVMLIVNAFQAGQGRVLAVVLGALALIAGTALFLRPVRNLPTVDRPLGFLGRGWADRIDRVRRRHRSGLGLGLASGLASMRPASLPSSGPGSRSSWSPSWRASG